MEVEKKYLIRYWLEVSDFSVNQIGATAFDTEDLHKLLKSKGPKDLTIHSITEIKSLSELDQNHVLPNMEEFVSRGIWYPKGFR